MKNYKIEIAQTWSESVIVRATNEKEAKQKAWDKWKAKKTNYKLSADTY